MPGMIKLTSGTPKWLVYKGNPIKLDDLGVVLSIPRAEFNKETVGIRPQWGQCLYLNGGQLVSCRVTLAGLIGIIFH